ncbi:MAG: ABC transporter substrate-binding protein [Candidatus Omnitrophica bacterium]|nr:ABC transporter substrate-binding protein [Candidatus Omnitrophota bacterium]
MLLRMIACILTVFVSLVLPAGSASADGPDKVVVGSSPSLAAAGLFLAKEKGFFEEEGLDVTIEIFKQSTVQILPLLATNKIDVAACGYSSGLLNAFTEDTGIKMVACLGRHFPGRSHLAMLISKQLYPDKMDRDVLEGKVFALPTRGVIQEIITERFLQQYGLGLEDVELVNLSYPNMNAALAGGSIFGAMQLEPYASKAVEEGYAVEVIRAAELRPNFQGGVLLYSRDLMEERPDVAGRFMVAYLRGVRYFNDFLDGAIKDDHGVFDIIDKYTALGSYEAFQKIQFGGVNPDGFLDKTSIGEDIDWYHERGYITQRPDPADIVDDSFCEYAVSVLGKYPPHDHRER